MSNFKKEIAETIKFIDEIFGDSNRSIKEQPFKFYGIKLGSKGDSTIASVLTSILVITHKIDNVNDELSEETNSLYKKNNKIIREQWQRLKKVSGLNKNNPGKTTSRNGNKMASVCVDKTSEEIRRNMKEIDKACLVTHLKLVKRYRREIRSMFYHYFQNPR